MAFCSNCGNQLQQQAKFCQNCGDGVEIFKQLDEPISNNSSKFMSDIAENDMKLFVGEKYNSYYANKWFKNDNYKLEAKKSSINFAGFIFSTLWLVYRGMWGWAILLTFLHFLIISVLEATNTDNLFLEYLLVSVVVGLSGNYMYFEYAKKRIGNIKRISGDMSIVNNLLINEGKPSMLRAFGFFMLVVFIALLLEVAFYK